MACQLINSTRSIDCARGIGGIETIYLASKSTVTGTTVDANFVVTGITMSGSAVFYEYEMTQETASYTDTPTGDLANGSLFYEQILTLIFNRANSTLRNQVKVIAEGATVAIVKTRDGNYILLGEETGLEITSGTGGSGTAAGDRNGYELALRSVAKEPAKFVNSSVFADIFNLNDIGFIFLPPFPSSTSYALTTLVYIFIQTKHKKRMFARLTTSASYFFRDKL